MSNLSAVAELVPLFRELNNLKRIRAPFLGSVAERLFGRAWNRLLEEDTLTVALSETAHAVAAARLGAIDAEVLENGGLDASARLEILRRSFDAVAPPIEAELRAQLRSSLSSEPPTAELAAMAPGFVALLQNQPRAGATRPGHARVVLEPTESHAEHCAIVAVQSVLAAPFFGADAGSVFLTGLSHHLHNAYLPDAGDAGDQLLGEHLKPLQNTFRERALEELPTDLRTQAEASLDAVFRADTSEGRSFQVGDSLDRVLEMEWHARSANFTLDVALEEMDIIHPGPVQEFQIELMKAAGFKK